MKLEGYIKKLVDVYSAFYTIAYITMDVNGITVHGDTCDHVSATMGSFVDFLETEIKDVVLSMLTNGQYTELIDAIVWVEKTTGEMNV